MKIFNYFSGSCRKVKSEEGYSLMELLTVIAIFAVLLAIAIPSFLHWLPGIRLKDASTELFTDMYRAKAEAIKRNQNVVIQFTTASCSPTVPDGQGNYLIFIDTDGDNTLDSTETTLLQRTMPKDVALCSAFSGQTGFTSRGFLIVPTAGNIVLTNTDDRSYTVSLTVAGNISLN